MITFDTPANVLAAVRYTDGMNKTTRGVLNTFGKRVRVLREDLGLNQEDLCTEVRQRSGIKLSRPHLSNLERGEGMPALETAAAIAKVLDTSIDYLAMVTDDPSPTGAQEQSVYLSAEADETARLVDDMPPLLRAAVIVNARAIADADRDRRARNVAYYRRLMELLEERTSPQVRREIESRLGSFD